MTGTQYPGLNLGTVICLTVIILLHYNKRYRLNLFICGKALITFITNTTSADGIIFLGRS